MAKQLTTAFKAECGNTGIIFETKEAAEGEEIRWAAEALAGVSKNHLMSVATSSSGCQTTRNAIMRLAKAIQDHPIPVPMPTKSNS